MAHDPHAHHLARVHLSIDGDELVWTIHPKGFQSFNLVLIAVGLACAAGFGLLALNVLEDHGLSLYVRLVGSSSLVTAGLSLLGTFVYLALRDGLARATVKFDRHNLTVHEVVLYRSRRQQWSRENLKAVTVGHDRAHSDLLAALQSTGLIAETALRVESASADPQPVLGGLSLNGELTWLAAIMSENLNAPPGAVVPASGRDLLLEIDQHMAERGGRVPLPLAGPNGAGWGTVMVAVPAGVCDGARLPLHGIGPGGGDLHVCLRVSESDERADTFELSRQLAHNWEY